MMPLWLRNVRERVAAMSPLRRAAVTFAYMLVSGIIVMPLLYWVFDYFVPGERPTPSHLVEMVGCEALVFSVLGYFGIIWGNGPASRDS